MGKYSIDSVLSPTAALSTSEIPDILSPYECGVFKTLLTHPRATPILKDVLTNYLELDIESVIVEDIEPTLPLMGKECESFVATCEFNCGKHAVVEMQAKAIAGDTIESTLEQIPCDSKHKYS